MTEPRMLADYHETTVHLDPHAMHIIAVLPGRPARPIWFADDRDPNEYANLSQKDLGVITALLNRALAEVVEAHQARVREDQP